MFDKELMEAIENKDLLTVHSIVLRQINYDRKLKVFKNPEYVRIAEPRFKEMGIALFLDNSDDLTVDGTVFSEDKSKWDREMWDNMRIELDHNFSREKFDRLIAVMRYLREQEDPHFQVDETDKTKSSAKKSAGKAIESNSQEKTTAGAPEAASSKFTQYAAGAGIGAASLGLVGKAVGFSLLGGVIVGAVVGAGVVYMNNKKD